MAAPIPHAPLPTWSKVRSRSMYHRYFLKISTCENWVFARSDCVRGVGGIGSVGRAWVVALVLQHSSVDWLPVCKVWDVQPTPTV